MYMKLSQTYKKVNNNNNNKILKITKINILIKTKQHILIK